MNSGANNVMYNKIKKSILIITTDFSNDDVDTMLVSRLLNDSRLEVINRIHGDEALEIYHNLVHKK